MRTQWTTKGNRDAGSSCSCDQGLPRYLRNFGRGLNTPNPPPSVRHWPHMNTDCGLTTAEQQGNVRMTNTDMRSRNPCCHRQALSTAYAACVSLALVILHAKRMRWFVLSSVAWLAPLTFFKHYLINVTIFGKTLLNIKCVFWLPLQLLSETFLIPRGIHRDIIKNVNWLKNGKNIVKTQLYLLAMRGWIT